MEKKATNAQVGEFLGKLFSFNNSLKLYHWHVKGPASYAQHMALDQAIEQLGAPLDSLVETTYAMLGYIYITIPQTKRPGNIVSHAETFYEEVQQSREMFTEDFTESLLDDVSEAIQQLLYRLKRLS